MRTHRTASNNDRVVGVFEIGQGGTSGSTGVEAVDKLNGVTSLEVNQNNNALGLNDLGYIPDAQMGNLIDNSITLNGPTMVQQGITNQWTITNFDSGSQYNIWVNYGHVTMTDNKIDVFLPTFETLVSPFKLNVSRNRQTRFLEMPLSQGKNTYFDTGFQTSSSYKPVNTSFTTTVNIESAGGYSNTTYSGTRVTYLGGTHNTAYDTSYNTSHQTQINTNYSTGWNTNGTVNTSWLTSTTSYQNTSYQTTITGSSSNTSMSTSAQTFAQTTSGWNTTWATSIPAGWGNGILTSGNWTPGGTITGPYPPATVTVYSVNELLISVSPTSFQVGIADGTLFTASNNGWIIGNYSGRVLFGYSTPWDGAGGGVAWPSITYEVYQSGGGSSNTSVYTSSTTNTYWNTSAVTSWATTAPSYYQNTSHQTAVTNSWNTSNVTALSWNTQQQTSNATMAATTYQTSHNTNNQTANTESTIQTSWKTSSVTNVPSETLNTTWITTQNTFKGESSWYTKYNTTVQTKDIGGVESNTSWTTEHLTRGPGGVLETSWEATKQTTVPAHQRGTEWNTTTNTIVSGVSQNTTFTTTHQTWKPGPAVQTSVMTTKGTFIPVPPLDVNTLYDTLKQTAIVTSYMTDGFVKQNTLYETSQGQHQTTWNTISSGATSMVTSGTTMSYQQTTSVTSWMTNGAVQTSQVTNWNTLDANKPVFHNPQVYVFSAEESRYLLIPTASVSQSRYTVSRPFVGNLPISNLIPSVTPVATFNINGYIESGTGVSVSTEGSIDINDSIKFDWTNSNGNYGYIEYARYYGTIEQNYANTSTTTSWLTGPNAVQTSQNTLVDTIVSTQTNVNTSWNTEKQLQTSAMTASLQDTTWSTSSSSLQNTSYATQTISYQNTSHLTTIPGPMSNTSVYTSWTTSTTSYQNTSYQTMVPGSSSNTSMSTSAQTFAQTTSGWNTTWTTTGGALSGSYSYSRSEIMFGSALSASSYCVPSNITVTFTPIGDGTYSGLASAAPVLYIYTEGGEGAPYYMGSAGGGPTVITWYSGPSLSPIWIQHGFGESTYVSVWNGSATGGSSNTSVYTSSTTNTYWNTSAVTSWATTAPSYYQNTSHQTAIVNSFQTGMNTSWSTQAPGTNQNTSYQTAVTGSKNTSHQTTVTNNWNTSQQTLVTWNTSYQTDVPASLNTSHQTTKNTTVQTTVVTQYEQGITTNTTWLTSKNTSLI